MLATVEVNWARLQGCGGIERARGVILLIAFEMIA